jgi:DNA-3-methyladenine glycosylase I
MTRCDWVGDDPAMILYHDTEWGTPLHDDRALFESLSMQVMQAGLSWRTILRKRDNFRSAFVNFDPATVARFDQSDINRLMQDAGIVRNELKIKAIINNAQQIIAVQKEFGSFDTYLWRFVDSTPIVNSWKSLKEIPPQTELSKGMSKLLLKRGFRFVGPTICYAYMQAVGMVNDHLVTCFRYNELTAKR